LTGGQSYNGDTYGYTFDNYFKDKFGNVFKGLQSLKLLPKKDGIALVIAIFSK
jgi:hypothetical protein